MPTCMDNDVVAAELNAYRCGCSLMWDIAVHYRNNVAVVLNHQMIFDHVALGLEDIIEAHLIKKPLLPVTIDMNRYMRVHPITPPVVP